MSLSRKVTRWHRMNDDPEKFPLGKPVLRHFAGMKICVIRTSKGIFAIQEKCPHNGFSLALGNCSEDEGAIICPLHRYQFDLTTGRARGGAAEAARVFPIEKREDGYYLGTEETEWGWF
ncbi:MAG TPA: Rieske 2Fe-2S domain-containing protein [Bacteroidia bacterium]|jgi:3-phenylpropionate/trans-cinnamate dioxygenase ferredoxin subunit|nr:Rieske 2Fe-2S domain-containing protein [Bacteroidia bacterium]